MLQVCFLFSCFSASYLSFSFCNQHLFQLSCFSPIHHLKLDQEWFVPALDLGVKLQEAIIAKQSVTQFLYRCNYSVWGFSFAVWRSEWHNSPVLVTPLYSCWLEYTVFFSFRASKSSVYSRRRKSCDEIHFRCASILVTFQLCVPLYTSSEKNEPFTACPQKNGRWSQIAFSKSDWDQSRRGARFLLFLGSRYLLSRGGIEWGLIGCFRNSSRL